MARKKDQSGFAASNALLVLALLEGEDKYGYQLIEELEKRSDYAFCMKEGSLYPILHTLEAQGEVRSYEKAAQGRRRRYYKLTRQGVRTLARCRKEWERFAKGFGKVLGGEACVCS